MNYAATLLALAAGLAFAGAALAAAPLEGRTITGDKVDAYDVSAVMIYDPDADLTWLRDWNVNGAKTWQDQLAWAGSLKVGAFSNWSLPTSLNLNGSGLCSPSGFNCKGSPMGHLWYEVLGNTAGSFTNAGPFQNVQSYDYWSSTEYTPFQYYSWFFSTLYGYQYVAGKHIELYAVAVHPGDVFAVPEPQTWAMMLMGLGAVGFLARRRQS